MRGGGGYKLGGGRLKVGVGFNNGDGGETGGCDLIWTQNPAT